MCWLASRGLSLYTHNDWSSGVVDEVSLLTTYEGACEAPINSSELALRNEYASDQQEIVDPRLRRASIRTQVLNNADFRVDSILQCNNRYVKEIERCVDSQQKSELFLFSACKATYLRVNKPYNNEVYKVKCEKQCQLSILKKFKKRTKAVSEECQKCDHTVEFGESKSLKHVRLFDAPVQPMEEQQNCFFTVGDHCLLFYLCSLYIKCPGKLHWRKLSVFIPDLNVRMKSFRAVIPFGIGVYIVADHGHVYFMPLRTFKCKAHGTHSSCNPDACYSLSLILFPYAKLKTKGHQVCRVEDKLYIAGGCSDQKDKLLVEVLQLLYNPLEPTGDIKDTPDPASVPFVESLFEEHCPNEFSSRVSTTHECSCNQQDQMSYKDSNKKKTVETTLVLSRDVDPPAAATPDGETVLPDVMPSASSIRRAAATQHRLMDRGVLKPLLNFYHTAPLFSAQLSPAGLLALSLIEEMKSNFYPNWTIVEIDHFNLPEEERFFENDECRWCRNVSKLWPMPAECNLAQRESTVIEVTNNEWTCVRGSMNDGRANDFQSFAVLTN